MAGSADVSAMAPGAAEEIEGSAARAVRGVVSRTGRRGSVRRRLRSARVRAIRKTERAGRKLPKEAARKGGRVQRRTLGFARHATVSTTFPEPAFTASEVLQWYRTRRQVEPILKRFRSPTRLGHLPERDDESAGARP